VNTVRPRLRHAFPGLLIFAVLSGGQPLRAAEDPFTALARFRYGQPAEVLAAVEAEVHRAAPDPARRAEVERALLAVLRGPAAPEARRFACAQLRAVGSAQAVPALAEALNDPEIGTATLAVLEVLPDPAAGAALRAALKSADGPRRIALVNALARRAESASVPVLVPLLELPEPDVVAAAVLALGRIADDSALDALRALAAHYDPRVAEGDGPLTQVRPADSVKPVLVPALAEAFLQCADTFRAGGRRELAAAVFERLYAAENAPAAARVAALRGWVETAPERAAATVLALLESGTEGWDRIALGLLRALPAEQVTAALASRLATFPPGKQAAVLAVLAERPVAGTGELLLAAGRHPEAEVRVAAWTGLGHLEANENIARELLAAAAGRSGPEQQAARASLARARGPALDEVLLRGLTTGPVSERAECARALAARGVRRALPALLTAAREAEPGVRAAAWQALAGLAGATEYPDLLRLLLAATTDADRDAALKALLAAAADLPDSAARTRPLIEAFSAASPAARVTLLAALGQLGGPDALATVRAALRDPDETVQAEALATLAGWPDPEPLPDLLALAETPSTPARRVVALRGAVALADQATNLPPARLLEVYRRALAAAARPEEKRLVLAGLARLSEPAAADLVEPLLADPTVRDDAALALAQLARRLAGANPARARTAVERARSASTQPAVQAAAGEVLDQLERDRDYVVSWLLAGPFTAAGPGRLIDLEFPPETGGPVQWRPVPAPGGIVDLASVLGGEQRVAYLRATLHSPRAQRVQLQLGSDDGLKVWLNGQVVHRADVDRGLVPGQDRLEVELREGRNTLLLKVTQFGGGWAASCRIRGPDGASVPGLTVTAE
jgi:HEAT repeat protein